MAISQRYAMRPDHLLLEMAGPFAIADACRRFTELMEWISGKDVHRILVDGRAVTGTPSTIDYYEYGAFIAAEVARFTAAGKIGRVRLTYVVATSLLDKDRLTQTVARNRGVAILITDGMDEGLRWLASGSPA